MSGGYVLSRTVLLFSKNSTLTSTRRAPNHQLTQSRYLFCDFSHGWPACASKIVLGGDCSGFVRGEDCCYNGRCVNNVCVANVNNFGTITRTVTGTRTRPFFLTTQPRRTSLLREPKECLNEHECCSLWANAGYCSRNPTYMNASCKAACGLCPANYTIAVEAQGECTDLSSSCPATADGCQTRVDWMKENCRKSCSFCDKTRRQACTVVTTTAATRSSTPPSRRALLQQRSQATSSRTKPPRPTTLPPSPPRPSSQTHLQVRSCVDNHFCCPLWSSKNHCTYGSKIQKTCSMSCSVCRSNTTSVSSTECSDFHPHCRAWAKSNFCNTRKDYMWENCKWSCRKCDLLRPGNRQAACQSLRPPTSKRIVQKPTTSQDAYVIPKETPPIATSSSG